MGKLTKTSQNPAVEEVASKKIGFLDKVCARLNKTEAEKQQDKVIAFQKRTIILCHTQIGLITNREIPILETEITELSYKLDEAKEKIETSKYSIADTPEQYVKIYNQLEQEIDAINNKILEKVAIAEEAGKRKEKYQEMLEWLQ